ncbi:MAG: four helix bundle protein [Hyphomicrobiales bacterium]
MSKADINSYRDLLVWQKAMDLAVLCYSLTRRFPRHEMFGLTSQITRSSASVAANIAEGHGRENSGSFVQFLRIAQGSLKETETHLLLSERVGLLQAASAAEAMKACDEIGRMLRSLIRAVQEKQ